MSCGENPGNSQHTPKTPRDAEADRLRKRILNITMNPRGLIGIRWKGKKSDNWKTLPNLDERHRNINKRRPRINAADDTRRLFK